MPRQTAKPAPSKREPEPGRAYDERGNVRPADPRYTEDGEPDTQPRDDAPTRQG